MKIHRIKLFRPYPLDGTLTLEAKAVCSLPCAVQTFRLAGTDGRTVAAHIIWQSHMRGIAEMAFVDPDAPAWADDMVHRIVDHAKENAAGR